MKIRHSGGELCHFMIIAYQSLTNRLQRQNRVKMARKSLNFGLYSWRERLFRSWAFFLSCQLPNKTPRTDAPAAQNAPAVPNDTPGTDDPVGPERSVRHRLGPSTPNAPTLTLPPSAHVINLTLPFLIANQFF